MNNKSNGKIDGPEENLKKIQELRGKGNIDLNLGPIKIKDEILDVEGFVMKQKTTIHTEKIGFKSVNEDIDEELDDIVIEYGSIHVIKGSITKNPNGMYGLQLDKGFTVLDKEDSDNPESEQSLEFEFQKDKDSDIELPTYTLVSKDGNCAIDEISFNLDGFKYILKDNKLEVINEYKKPLIKLVRIKNKDKIIKIIGGYALVASIGLNINAYFDYISSVVKSFGSKVEKIVEKNDFKYFEIEKNLETTLKTNLRNKGYTPIIIDDLEGKGLNPKLIPKGTQIGIKKENGFLVSKIKVGGKEYISHIVINK